MTPQIPLFLDDYHDAVRHAVEALGGFKKVGGDMRPDLAVDAAGRWLVAPLCAATGSLLLAQFIDLQRAMEGQGEVERLAAMLREAA